MSVRHWLFRLRHRQPLLLLAGLAILLAALDVVVDFVTWIELNVSIVYGLTLILAAAARARRLLWILMLVLVATTFVAYSMQIPPGHFSLGEPFFVNRVLSAVALLLTAALGDLWIRAAKTLETQARDLKDRNAQLDAANRELVRREEQIVQQNEELQLRRREAEETNSQKTRLLASLSHDIRTPLNVINLVAEVVRRTADDPAMANQLPDMAQRLQSNARSLAVLVSDLVDLARLDWGGVELKESTFSLGGLIVGQCDDLLPLARTKGLRLEAQAPAPPIWLRADQEKLARVLSNLIGNAIKYTEVGSVTIGAVVTPQEAVLLHVRDTGVGIAPEQLERVFDEFVQLQNQEGDRKKGWGLGLAICRRLINRMGGTIGVASALGRGSAFTVRLPWRCVVEVPNDALQQSCLGDRAR